MSSFYLVCANPRSRKPTSPRALRALTDLEAWNGSQGRKDGGRSSRRLGVGQPALGPALARFEAVCQGSNQLRFMGKVQGVPSYSPPRTHVSAHAHTCVCTRMCAHTFPTNVERYSTVRMSLFICSPTEGRPRSGTLEQSRQKHPRAGFRVEIGLLPKFQFQITVELPQNDF